jgi:protein-arginine kinase
MERNEKQLVEETLEELREIQDGIDLGDVEQCKSDQFGDLRNEYYDDLIDKYYGTSLRNEKQYTIFDEVNGDS